MTDASSQQNIKKEQ